ncbi:MAG: serine hydrolase [Bacteroidales bacterium]|jgi:beta-glucosidase-like glycosyl hydrolase/CubicO group peptidase (beta-lactamase class C family)|nr:serine hydrolase [Bacteroidales bacterium]
MKHTFLTLIVTIAITATSAAKPATVATQAIIPYYCDSACIEEQIRNMSVKQLAAQTIIVRVQNKYTPAYAAEIAKMIKRTGYGGVCFFKGTTRDMLPLAQVLRDNSKIPVWITIDGEWGPAMRLTDVSKFPQQQTLGAISNSNLIYQMGQLVGEQCRTLGITWNFIPDADVNCEPRNPVIGTRSFGEDPVRVAELCNAYNAGVLSKNVMTSAKHFPGHGNTSADSHYDLPLVSDDFATIDTIHLLPFKTLIATDVSSIMIAHLNVPAIDTSKTPSSLSYPVITELLKEKLGYKGLVITDGLEMKGVLRSDLSVIKSNFKDWHNTTGEIEVSALLAGNDVLLLPENPENSIAKIVEAVKDNRLPRARLEDAVRKILTAKNSSSFRELYYRPVASPDSALILVNTKDVEEINRLLFANAITLLKNDNDIIPLHCDTQAISINANDTATYTLIDSAKTDDVLVINIKNTNILANKNYGITPQTIKFVSQLSAKSNRKILVLFASPYALSLFDTNVLNGYDAIIAGYQDMPEAQQAMAQIISGERPVKGTLPVSVVSQVYKAGDGIKTVSDKLYRSSFEEVGWKKEWVARIDSIALDGIRQKAYPGCQILIAKGNAVFYNKNFGHFTYDSTSETVNSNSIYDLASLSKIFGTTLAYMKLYEQGEFELDEPLSKNVRRLLRSPKGKITFRQLFSHQGGLKATMKWVTDSVYQYHKIFSREYDENDYPFIVADSIYLYKKYRTQIRKMIDESPLSKNPRYVYSDLGFYYLNEAFERITKTTLDEFATDSFYRPLGLKHFGYHPLQWADKSNIAPTENDTIYRKQLVQGYVHDPLVALMGGVGGSAGLFGNATDVAVICRMFLQGGTYAGKQYLKSETLNLFTSYSFSSAWNHRAGGFNKPAIKPDQVSACCEAASIYSYGHSGFTGTYFWVDPANDLIYVFISNRVHPSAKPNTLSKLNIRTEIQKLIYEFDASADASKNALSKSIPLK